MQNISRHWETGKTVGFVPTMGFLHAGHLSLVQKAEAECDIVVVSIYVNPSQFGPNEDFSKYPRNLQHDLDVLSAAHVDYVFCPHDQEMYPSGYATWIMVDCLSDMLCGKSRPNHFMGVATIVAKLMNLVQPAYMYMGEKDFQQIVVLEKMINDLHFNTRIRRCPIVREKDGLALSSRNQYLSPAERVQALSLSHGLEAVHHYFSSGGRDVQEAKNLILRKIEAVNGIVDYIEIVDSQTLQNVNQLQSGNRVLLAVYIGKTRLIDNREL
jgi:pantoate--beta-alanine ligase